MRQHVGVFTANFSSNLLWQNCFAPKKSAFCAEPRRVAAGILDVCQGGATTGLRETRLLRRMFSYARRPKGRALQRVDKPTPLSFRTSDRGGQSRPPLQTRNDSALRGGAMWASPAVIRCGNAFSRRERQKTGQAARRLPCFLMVPVTGLEPVRCRQRWILSPLRLPIPSHRQMLPAHYTVNGAGLQDKFTRRRR